MAYAAIFSYSTGNKMPPELTDTIIHELRYNRPALLNCSLVCRNWIPASRTHLFRTVRIFPKPSFCAFVENLNSPDSTISGYVRHIIYSPTHNPPHVVFPNSDYLKDVESIEIRHVNWKSLVASSNVPTLSTFPRLKSLVLTDIFLEDQCQIRDITGILPSLECLCLDIMYTDHTGAHLRQACLDQYLPSLRNLDLVSFRGNISSWFPPPHSIDTLSIGNSSCARHDMAMYRQYLLSLGPSLKHLVLRDVLLSDLLDLHRNTEILTLEVHFRTRYVPDFTFIMEQLVNSQIKQVIVRIILSEPCCNPGWDVLEKLNNLFIPPHFPSLEKLEFLIGGFLSGPWRWLIKEQLSNCDTRRVLRIKEYTK